VAIESAGIVLVRSDPRDAVAAIKLSRATYRKMIQNLVWATAYNLVAIPGRRRPPRPMGTRSAHERWGSRNEPLYHHRGCECATASEAETGGQLCLNRVIPVRDDVVSLRFTLKTVRPCRALHTAAT
jgi:hypothetical protein